MKKIIYAIIVAASVVACGKVDNSMYFDTSNKRIYDDATAEFDTLSYAVGMNLGLGLHFQPSGLTFDPVVLMEALDAEMAKDALNYEEFDANKELIRRFSSERLQPYAIAKFANKGDKSPMQLSIMPELFDEEFTQERVSQLYGRDIAGYITISAYPLNMHWLRTAIDEAFAAETEVIHDSLMRLTVVQMRNSLQNYHARILPTFLADASDKWLEGVSKQPGVNAMVIDDFDTLYFRVNKAGNGVKPRSLNDTISFSYDLYTRSGKLVESHAKRAETLRNALEEAKAADTIPNSNNKARIKQLTDQLDNVENLRIPVSKGLLKGLQYAVQNVGEGGNITVWMPASLAFGERGNRAVQGNDAVVMNISLKSVSYGPTDEELAAQEEAKKSAESVATPKFEKVPIGPRQKPNGENIVKPLKPTIENRVVVQPVDKK